MEKIVNEYRKYTARVNGLFTGVVEVWKDVEGYEGSYQVSSFGRIKSLARTRLGKNNSIVNLQEKIMSQKTSKSGYKNIGFHSSGKKFFSVHRLVALAFIPKVEGKDTVNHIDGKKQNNNISNLEWCDHKEQMIHAVENNLLEKRGSPKFSKKLKMQVLDYFNENKDISIFKLSQIFGISERTAGRIVKEGVKPRPTTRVLKDGARVVESILTKDQVAEIKLLRGQGWTFKRLSEKFNRGLSQMHRVVNDLSRNSDIE
jgi:hypothetical protein